MMATRLWALGADDPEMVAIRRHIGEAGEVAISADEAIPAVGPDGRGRWTEVVMVELTPEQRSRVSAAMPGIMAVVVDHHRPGDPGYGRPPDEYWQASSLGQCLAILHRDPDPDDILAAAADHCLAAAYIGLCPHVDPVRLSEWRIETRAAHQGRSPDDLRSDIGAALQTIVAAPRLAIGGVEVADLRGVEVAELVEASLRGGIMYLATPRPGRDHRRKVTLGGGGYTGARRAVEAFLGGWAAEQGLAEPYGDPSRGFAGAYL